MRRILDKTSRVRRRIQSFSASQNLGLGLGPEPGSEQAQQNFENLFNRSMQNDLMQGGNVIIQEQNIYSTDPTTAPPPEIDR